MGLLGENEQVNLETEISKSSFGIDGYLFQSADEKQVVQFRTDGFSFSRLKPYTSWDSVKLEASRLWQLLSDATKPQLVTRLAVRYINSIDVPAGTLKQYLTFGYKIPDELPQNADEVLLRFVLSFGFAKAIVTVAPLPPPDPTKERVMFDIDVFSELSVKANAVSVWETFDKLAEIKNKIFFEGISAEPLRLFQ